MWLAKEDTWYVLTSMRSVIEVSSLTRTVNVVRTRSMHCRYGRSILLLNMLRDQIVHQATVGVAVVVNH